MAVGFLEGASYSDETCLVVSFFGWATDVFNRIPADEVYILDENDNLVASDKPRIERKDVVSHFSEEGVLTSGFDIQCDASGLVKGAGYGAAIKDVDGNFIRLTGSVSISKEQPKMFSGYDIKQLLRRGLKLGKNFDMQPDCFIDYSHCWLIEIGDNVTFSSRVHLLAHDGSLRKYTGKTLIGPIKIGNFCFLGNNVMVLPGVTIADRCVVGAGSVVTKDVPANSVVAGSPAKVVCTIDELIEKREKVYLASPVFSKDFLAERGVSSEKKDLMARLIGSSPHRIGFIDLDMDSGVLER